MDGKSWTAHVDRERSWLAHTGRTDFPGGGVPAMAVTPDSTVWAATDWTGVAAFDGKDWTNYTIDDGLASGVVFSVAIGPEGTIWVGALPADEYGRRKAADGGLSTFDGGQWISYTTEDGLVDNEVRSVAVADDCTVWAGTSEGVSSFDGDEWTTYTEEDGLDDADVASLAVTEDGQLLARAHGEVSIFDGETWSRYRDGNDGRSGHDRSESRRRRRF